MKWSRFRRVLEACAAVLVWTGILALLVWYATWLWAVVLLGIPALLALGALAEQLWPEVFPWHR